MRGKDEQQLDVFSYISPEQRVPHDHPLRPLRVMTDEALRELQPRFNKLYAKTGRPSIAPEKLLRALLLQALYSVRSERMLMEQLNYNLLFRWFVGLNMDDSVWDVTVFTKNRERLLDGDIAEAFFQAVLQQARERNLLSDEHFTVDGTLLEAWASVKSYQRKDAKNGVPPDDPGNATVDFHGEKRSNETHQSKTDPDAKMARKGKGKEAKLSYNGNLLVENRHGLIVNSEVFEANGTAERDAALVMLEQIPGTRQVTVGGDKAYDTADFVAECRNLKVTPHVAQNLERPGGSAIDARTTQHPGYAISQRKRKRIEECFGWLKTIALLRKVRHRGIFKVGWAFTFAAAAYNLVRMRNLAIQASKPRSQCARRTENESAGHQRMQPEPFPNHKITETGENLSRGVHFSAAC
jgi:transposase